MNTPAEEQITKLPKWAQDHIRNLNRQRDAAVRKMEDTINENQDGPFVFSDFVCVEKGALRSVETRFKGRRLEVHHAGVELHLLLSEGGHRGKPAIDLQYSAEDTAIGDVCLTPHAFQNIRLHLP